MIAWGWFAEVWEKSGHDLRTTWGCFAGVRERLSRYSIINSVGMFR